MASLSEGWVLLRESLSGTVTRFETAHAAALLAYPGTVWAEVKEEIHEAAEAVADWSTPAPAEAPTPEATESEEA